MSRLKKSRTGSRSRSWRLRMLWWGRRRSRTSKKASTVSTTTTGPPPKMPLDRARAAIERVWGREQGRMVRAGRWEAPWRSHWGMRRCRRRVTMCYCRKIRVRAPGPPRATSIKIRMPTTGRVLMRAQLKISIIKIEAWRPWISPMWCSQTMSWAPSNSRTTSSSLSKWASLKHCRGRNLLRDRRSWLSIWWNGWKRQKDQSKCARKLFKMRGS